MVVTFNARYVVKSTSVGHRQSHHSLSPSSPLSLLFSPHALAPPIDTIHCDHRGSKSWELDGFSPRIQLLSLPLASPIRNNVRYLNPISESLPRSRVAVDKNAVKFHDRKAVDDRGHSIPRNTDRPRASVSFRDSRTIPSPRVPLADRWRESTLPGDVAATADPRYRSDGALWPVRRRGRETSRGDRTESAE